MCFIVNGVFIVDVDLVVVKIIFRDCVCVKVDSRYRIYSLWMYVLWGYRVSLIVDWSVFKCVLFKIVVVSCVWLLSI